MQSHEILGCTAKAELLWQLESFQTQRRVERATQGTAAWWKTKGTNLAEPGKTWQVPEWFDVAPFYLRN